MESLDLRPLVYARAAQASSGPLLRNDSMRYRAIAMTKTFRLSADQIKRLAPGHGACIASDRITVDGRPVGFMYRGSPDNEHDSGWRFMAGDENQHYMDDPDNHGVYDVNTIANYDPAIIPLLDAPRGSVFERQEGSGRFVPVEDWAPPDD
jgi:hypothetical protein